MSSRNKNIIAGGAVLLAMVFFYPRMSLAQGEKIAVDRGVIELSAQSGQDVEFSFRVRNDSGEKQKIDLEEKDIEFGDDNSYSLADAKDGPSSLVEFRENNFILEPHATKKVDGIVKFSQEKKEASSYNMLTLVSFSSISDDGDQSGPRIQGSIGIYTFVKIGDNHDAGGKIENVILPIFLKPGQEMRIAYRNIGDVYFVPKKSVRIKNLLGNFQEDIPLGRHFVFPGKRVFFLGKIGNIPPWGLFRVSTKFVDGNGKAETVDKYACGYLFPWGAGASLLGIILLAIFILRKRNQVSISLMEKR
jgi:hypothetical protein